MRAFFCLPIDERLRAQIAETSNRIRHQTSMTVSWVRPENYHVTLRFLGEVDPLAAPRLQELARRAGHAVLPFAVRFDSVGAFPSADRARVLWVGAAADPSFRTLVDALERGLLEMGFPTEAKPSVAHVTMARIKGRADGRLPEIVSDLNPFPVHSLLVDRVILMESRLSPTGAEYVPLFSVPLGAAS